MMGKLLYRIIFLMAFCYCGLGAVSLAVAQISEEQFAEAQQEEDRLVKAIREQTIKLGQASPDEYDGLKAEYDTLVATRLENRKTIIAFQRANKELTSVHKLYNDAQQKLRLNQADAALKLYNDCIAKAKQLGSPSLNSTVAKAYYGIGYVYANKKRQRAKALEFYNKSLEYSSNNDKAYEGIGTAHYYMGNNDDAIRNYQKAIELNPLNTRALRQMGATYLRTKKFSDAESIYLKATEVDAKDYRAFEGLGRALVEQRRYREAVGPLEHATKLSSKSHLGYFYLAKAHNAQGNHKAAITAADASLKAKRGYGGALVEKGVAYKKLGNETRAIENFRLAARDRTWREQANYEIKMIEFEKQGQ